MNIDPETSYSTKEKFLGNDQVSKLMKFTMITSDYERNP